MWENVRFGEEYMLLLFLQIFVGVKVLFFWFLVF